MSGGSKLIASMVFILIFGITSLSLAEYYSQDSVDAPKIVKDVSKKIDSTVKKAQMGDYSPGSVGNFIPKPPPIER